MEERERRDAPGSQRPSRAEVAAANPSGLNAHYQLADLAAAFAALRDAAAGPPTSGRPGSQPAGPA